MDHQKLKKIIKNPQDNIWIIDVRPSTSYTSGHIPTAKSYPSSEILKRLDKLSKDQFLILYCETGGRAQAVIKQLKKVGHEN